MIALRRICYFFCIICCSVTIALAQSESIHLSGDNDTFRLFLAPTSLTLPANHGSVQLAELSVPCVNYGIIDELIVRGGITPFTITGHSLYFGMLGLQVFDYDGFSGVGGVAFTDITGASRNWEPALYGFGVIGYSNSKFGVFTGFGGGYSSSRESNSAIFMVGGEYSISAHNTLVSENWFVSETGVDAFSIGIRIFGKTLSGEFGIVAITKEHSLKISTVAPWISLSYHFDTSEE